MQSGDEQALHTSYRLAGLLDLSIRHDTNGAAGLDEVMRSLFTDLL